MKLIFVAFMLLFSGEAAFAYEQPKYEIVKIYKGFELRRYAPYIVAETVVSGKFDDAGNKAFRILFKYISGDNLKKTEIPMTAPVITPVKSICRKKSMKATPAYVFNSIFGCASSSSQRLFCRPGT